MQTFILLHLFSESADYRAENLQTVILKKHCLMFCVHPRDASPIMTGWIKFFFSVKKGLLEVHFVCLESLCTV